MIAIRNNTTYDTGNSGRQRVPNVFFAENPDPNAKDMQQWLDVFMPAFRDDSDDERRKRRRTFLDIIEFYNRFLARSFIRNAQTRDTTMAKHLVNSWSVTLIQLAYALNVHNITI